ncbi:MAG: hypothetical protein JXL81_06020 [Deltaproteobacteria bacterium]|nr:hypothetical protein [Deltaproteobacteria bacterium]
MYCLILLLFSVTFYGCATPPKNPKNLCDIFDEKGGWYKDARRSYRRWGSPIPVMMAMMHRESSFKKKVKPARTRILWIIPGPRPSTAYGYSQALETTWNIYKRETGNYGADRDDFDDAIDFVGWYNHKSHIECGIKPDNAYALYLAYHEGQNGYNQGTYKDKAWLIKAAKEVASRAVYYRSQLNGCQKRLEGPWWWPF